MLYIYRACTPPQRLAMTPIFAVLLSFFPIQIVYLTLGAMLFGLAVVLTRIHARL